MSRDSPPSWSGRKKKNRPARAFLGAWARGKGEVPAVHNSKTIYGIEIKFGRVAENHKLINLA